MNPVMRRAVSAALFTPALLAASQPQAGVPTLNPPPPSTMPATASPAPVVPPPAPLLPIPSLSSDQLAQLRKMLDGAAADGIAADGQTSAAPYDAGQDAIVRAALDYAKALHHGRLANGDFMENWGLRPAAYDPRADFIAAVQADKLSAWIASLPPPWSGYDTLRKALATYRGIEKSGGWPALASGTDLVPGATGERVATLRERLSIEDKALAKGPARYDDDVVAAVQRAQRRYGIEPTGRSAHRRSRRSTSARTIASARSRPTWSGGAGCPPNCPHTACR